MYFIYVYIFYILEHLENRIIKILLELRLKNYFLANKTI